MTVKVWDTASGTFAPIPSNAEAVLYYTDLAFANGVAARHRFPALFQGNRALGVTSAGGNHEDDHILDWEPHNPNPNPHAWAVMRLDGGHVPRVYADLSDLKGRIIPSLGSALLDGGPGQRKCRIHTAHPTGHEHICGPGTCGELPFDADCTQYWWASIQGPSLGANLDISLAREDYFEGGAVKPVDEYDLFYDDEFDCVDARTGKKVRLNERSTVKAFDQAIRRPLKNAASTIDLWYAVLALRKHVWEKAHDPLGPDGKPTWGLYRRGGRWHALNNRTEGL